MDEEVEEFIAILDALKSRVRDFVREIGDEGITWSPDMADTNSVAVIVTHMFGSEAEAIQEFVGGGPVKRDRGSEFASPVTTVRGLVELIDQVGALSRDVLTRETWESLGRQVRTFEPGKTHTARRALIGVLTHQAEHIGHMQLTEQIRQAR